MMASLLEHINSPKDLRALSPDLLPQLADEVRTEIIRVIARNGGHLGASLGTVELTIALHYVFDTPRDRIVWDVGHQAHGHKILTDRRQVFHTIRQKGGISGFPSRAESEYDTFGVGHASTAISAALGMAAARDLARKDYRVVAVVGDGALTGGIAFEGINNAGILKSDLLVILNDNKMSISKNVGALSHYLTKVTSGKIYNRLEADVWELLGLIPKVGGKTRKLAHRIKESFKNLIVPGIIFEELGFRYFGPVDGHNVEFLTKTLSDVRALRGPILLHLITEKGKGVDKVEKDSQRYHAVSSFDRIPGDRPDSGGPPSYTSVFSRTLIKLANRNRKIVGITAAMPDGTGMADFAKEFPRRFFDVGIAEQHAVTFAGGLATEGYVPVVAVYSTFLQRAYDQIIHDIGLQKLPVRFVMDRAGVVGEDGPTHHGAFDVSYLRCIPNFVVMAPKDENELQRMLKTMVEYDQGPSAMRFPRGAGVGVSLDERCLALEVGKGELIREGQDVVFVAYGTTVYPALRSAEVLHDQNQVSAAVLNARFVKPLDTELLESVLASEPLVVTIEENVLSGGFGSAVLEHLNTIGYDTRLVRRLGIPDRYIQHAPRGDLLAECGLTVENCVATALEMIAQRKQRIFKTVSGRSA